MELPADLDRALGPRDIVSVVGPDAETYLHSQVSQGVTGMTVGEQRWTFVLDPSGKIIALARITRADDEVFSLDTDAGAGEALAARLRRFMIRVDAAIEITPAESGPDPDAERRRVEIGWPRIGAEIEPGETLVAGTGLASVAVDFRKGCYPGQELVERMDSRGADAPRALRRLDVGEDAAPGDAVVVEGAEVGMLTSVAGGRALAWVRRGADVGELVRFGAS
jgi:folate-binding protein YgfZ